MCELRNVKQGEYITLKEISEPKENQVWIRGEYDRSERKYSITRFSDIGDSRLVKGNRIVYTEFTF